MMMDIKERISLHDEDVMKDNVIKKSCVDCNTTKTPLWRGGPAGPKTLCNACGIRYRKRRRAMVALEKTLEKRKERAHAPKPTSTSTTSNPSNSTSNNVKTVVAAGNELRESLKRSLTVLGDEFMLQRSSIVKKQRCQRRKKLGEEEQAAFSLMALSCGSVFA